LLILDRHLLVLGSQVLGVIVLMPGINETCSTHHYCSDVGQYALNDGRTSSDQRIFHIQPPETTLGGDNTKGCAGKLDSKYAVA
jgi:hypothetical protein